MENTIDYIKSLAQIKNNPIELPDIYNELIQSFQDINDSFIVVNNKIKQYFKNVDIINHNITEEFDELKSINDELNDFNDIFMNIFDTLFTIYQQGNPDSYLFRGSNEGSYVDFYNYFYPKKSDKSINIFNPIIDSLCRSVNVINEKLKSCKFTIKDYKEIPQNKEKSKIETSTFMIKEEIRNVIFKITSESDKLKEDYNNTKKVYDELRRKNIDVNKKYLSSQEDNRHLKEEIKSLKQSIQENSMGNRLITNNSRRKHENETKTEIVVHYPQKSIENYVKFCLEKDKRITNMYVNREIQYLNPLPSVTPYLNSNENEKNKEKFELTNEFYNYCSSIKVVDLNSNIKPQEQINMQKLQYDEIKNKIEKSLLKENIIKKKIESQKICARISLNPTDVLKNENNIKIYINTREILPLMQLYK